MNPIDVIGCYGNRVSPMFRTLLEKAQIVAGSARLLKENSLPADAEPVVLDGTLCGVLRILRNGAKQKTVVWQSAIPFSRLGATLSVCSASVCVSSGAAAFQVFSPLGSLGCGGILFASRRGKESAVPPASTQSAVRRVRRRGVPCGKNRGDPAGKIPGGVGAFRRGRM